MPGGDSPVATKVIRPRPACTVCRGLKAKCVPVLTSDSPSAPCSRCVKYQLACDYTQKKRGRKRTVVTSPELPVPDVDFGGRETSEVVSLTPEGCLAPIDTDESSMIGHHLAPHLVLPSEAGPSHAISQFVLPSSSTPGALEVANYLEPDIGVEKSRAPTPAAMSGDFIAPEGSGSSSTTAFEDPMTVAGISAPEAQYLFRCYFEKLNVFVSLLDQKYHTFEIIRRNPPLFSAVLFSAARWFRPLLATALLSHVRTLIKRDLDRGNISVPLIQAICLMLAFKLPDDRSGWVYAGIAIRAAFQIGLHRARTHQLPAEDIGRLLDQERTWIYLQGVDRLYSRIFELPHMINSEFRLDATSWADEHASEGILTDFGMACMHSLGPIMDSLSLQTVNDRPAPRSLKNRLGLAEDHLERQIGVWLHSSRTNFLPEAVRMTFTAAVSLLRFIICTISAENYGRRKDDFELMSRALEALDRFDELAKAETLAYWSDTTAMMISQLGICIFKVRHLLDDRDVERLLPRLQRVQSLLYDSTSRVDNQALAKVAGFYRRLHRLFAVRVSSEEVSSSNTDLAGEMRSAATRLEDSLANAACPMDFNQPAFSLSFGQITCHAPNNNTNNAQALDLTAPASDMEHWYQNSREWNDLTAMFLQLPDA